MSNVEYDLDSSGSLMDQIQALIAPPSSEEDKEKKKPSNEHPYFKRPGKGHNHDSCDACGEGGDLICCDQCPSSFHLQCHDPPLEPKDIPRGVWMCHSCKYLNSKKILTSSAASSGGPHTRTTKRSSSTPASSSNSGAASSSSKGIKKIKLSAMDVLIEAANSMNPKQFELPRSMSVPCLFPGTDRSDASHIRKKAHLKPIQKDHELTPSGLVPLPAKKCNECRKSCKVAPLISCDYCPSYYHLDCLDPPLTTPPTGRWMCPIHVEHFLDSKLLKSVSATERVALWDKFTGPIDPDAVKLQFLRKIHSKNPPFRVKVKLPPRNRVKVPPMVKYHYQNPVDLLPSLKDVLRLNTVLRRTENVSVEEVQRTEEDSQSEENTDDVVCIENNKCSENCKLENSNLKCKGCFEINGMDSDSENMISDFRDNKNSSGDNEIVSKASDSELVKRSTKVEEFGEDTNCGFNNVYNGFVKTDLLNGVNYYQDIKKESCPKIEEIYNINDVELELKQLDDRLIKLLAFQRIQQLLTQQSNSQTALTAYFSTSLEHKLRHMPLPSELLTPADIDRISRVFASPKKKSKPKPLIRARAMLCPVVSQHFYNLKTSEVEPSSLRHDASFMGLRPTVSSRFPEAVAMKYRTIQIGRGSNNELDLERFGNCRCVSPRHAVIFYDEYTRHFELINYSPYGSYVNNVLYSNDLSQDHVTLKETPQCKTEILEGKVREVIDKKRKVTRPRKVVLEKMVANDCADRADCGCVNNIEDLRNGWEGSALLNHGALLRFGCISFVFSIVECSP